MCDGWDQDTAPKRSNYGRLQRNRQHWQQLRNFKTFNLSGNKYEEHQRRRYAAATTAPPMTGARHQQHAVHMRTVHLFEMQRSVFVDTAWTARTGGYPRSYSFTTSSPAV